MLLSNFVNHSACSHVLLWSLTYLYSLHDLVQVSGPSPIPPRYAFGVYYSRYHAYNDVGEKVSIIMIHTYAIWCWQGHLVLLTSVATGVEITISAGKSTQAGSSEHQSLMFFHTTEPLEFWHCKTVDDTMIFIDTVWISMRPFTLYGR